MTIFTALSAVFYKRLFLYVLIIVLYKKYDVLTIYYGKNIRYNCYSE